MKALFFAISLFVSLAHSAQCELGMLPDELTLVEDVMAWTPTLKLSEDKRVLAEVSQRQESFSPTYDLHGPSGEHLVVAYQRDHSWGVEIEFYDCKTNKVGAIRQIQLSKDLYELELLDAEGELLATSNSVDSNVTSIVLTSPEGEYLATLRRPKFQLFVGYWKIKREASSVDPSFLLILALHLTATR